MNVKFKVSEVTEERTSIPSLAKLIKELKSIIHDLNYFGTLRDTNSKQLDIHFDDVLLNKLIESNWYVEKPPDLKVIYMET